MQRICQESELEEPIVIDSWAMNETSTRILGRNWLIWMYVSGIERLMRDGVENCAGGMGAFDDETELDYYDS